jgi:BNR repeat-like domain
MRKKMSAVIIIVMVFSVSLAGSARGQWDFQRLTSNAGDSNYPTLGVSGSNLHVMWYDDVYGGDNDILYKRSTDDGSTWSFQRLSDNSGISKGPKVALSGSNIHLVWADNTLTGGGPYDPYEIFYKGSTDNGTTWSWQRLTSNSGDSVSSGIAVSDSSVHVVWRDDTYGNPEIFYKRSTNNGSTWSFQRLTNTSGASGSPSVAVSGTNVFVAWYDNTFGNTEIFFKRSTDNGATWSFQRLSNNTGNSTGPSVAVSGTNVHVVWYDDLYSPLAHNYEIFYKHSTDNGGTWAFQQLTNNHNWSGGPSISAVGHNVYVVWHDETYGNKEILSKRSIDGGFSWYFQRLSNNSGWSMGAKVVVRDTTPYVVWEDNTYGNYDIFYKQYWTRK